jgi:hypothetical protein
MKKLLIDLHHWLEMIPDKLYPFKQEIEGQWVRGIRAYRKVLDDGIKIHGPGQTSYRIMFYRGAWHLIGSVIFLLGTTLLANHLFGNLVALYVLMVAAIMALILQEFLLHPKRYGQSTRKGVIDVVTWVAPMVVYVAFLLL